MKTIIAELRETADSCRHAAQFADGATDITLRRKLRQEAVRIAAEAIDEVREELTEKTLHHIQAILDREADERVAEKHEAITSLLENGPTTILEQWVQDDPETLDKLDEITAQMIVWSTLLPMIAKHLEYIAVSLSARPTSSTVHHTTITGSTIGSIAVGDRSRATGTVSVNSGGDAGGAAKKSRSRGGGDALWSLVETYDSGKVDSALVVAALLRTC